MTKSNSTESRTTSQTIRHLGISTIVVLVFLAAMTAGAGSAAGGQAGGPPGISVLGDAAAQTGDSGQNTIRLRANGSITNYSFEARNLVPLDKTDISDGSDRLVNERQAIGSVGEGGIDRYRYTGSIYNFSTEDASVISVWVNDEPVNPENVGQGGELPDQSTPTPEPTEESDSTETPEPTETQTSTPAEVPDNYNLSNANFGNQPTSVGQEIQVTATVTNTGNEQLNTEIGLGTQGQVVDSQEVSLFPGSSQQVSFEYTYDSPGTYAIQIGPLNESGVMSQVGLRDSTVEVVAEGALTSTGGQIGPTTTAEAGGIPTIAPNQTTTSGSSFVAEQRDNLTIAGFTTANQSSPVRPGDLISFEANVSNPTSQRLNSSFTFAVDNGTVSQQTITVPAGETQSLVFTHRFAEAGNHTVSVGGQTKEIHVQPPQTTAANSSNASATTANASSQSSSGGTGGIINTLASSFLAIVLMVVLIIGGLAVFFFGWLKTSATKETIND
jgi:hypothetical protein